MRVRATWMSGMAAALVVACAVAGCSGNGSSASSAGGGGSSVAAKHAPGAVAAGDGSALGFGAAVPSESDTQAVKTNTSAGGEPFGPLIVKTGTLTLEIGHDAFDGIVTQANTIASEAGGYVVSSEVEGDRQRTGHIVIRVPSASFPAVMGNVQHLGDGKVTSRSVNGQDVTPEYIDLNARLTNLQAQEKVLLRLMNDAATVTDTIRVQSQLSGVQGAIEQLEGRVRYLRDAVRFQDSATLLLNDPEHVFLEVGPGNALATLVRRNAAEGTFPAILSTLPAPRDAQQDALTHATDAFAKLWLAGAKSTAGRAYKGEARRRIPLPAYPFQRERYDLLKGPPPALPRAAAARTVTTQGVELTVPSWPRTRASPQVPSLTGQRWLVLEADTPVASRVSERLRQAGADVVSLVAGQGASDPVTKRFAVDPSSPDAVSEHLERLRGEEWTPAHVAYLWPLVKEPRDLESGLATSFHGLLSLARAVGPGAAKTPVTLDVVTTVIAGAGLVLPLAILAGIAFLVGRAVWRRVEPAKPDEKAEASA